VGDPPAGDDWLHEIKFDGYRVLCRIEHGSVRLRSRTGADWTDRLPGVTRAASRLPTRAAMLDGEVAIVMSNGVTSFNALQNALGGESGDEPVYFVFDLLHLDGYDLAGTPLEARKQALHALLASGRAAPTLRYSDHVAGNGDAFLRQACRMQLEGVVSKRRDAPYESGRGRSWLKTKCVREQEFVVGGFTDPEGGRHGIGALLLGVYDQGGRLVYVGKVGTGFSHDAAIDIRRKLDGLAERTTPFASRPPGAARAHWVRPQLVGEVRFTEWTPEAIGDWILPHLRGRPASLVRCPEGLAGECFYQKHVGPGAPATLRRVRIREKKKAGDYLVVDDLPGLIGLVQLGVLEIHTWNAVAERLEEPDRLVFDLDPGDDVPWRDVVAAARRLRAYLQDAGLIAFPKTTGAKGLHLVVPIDRGPGWDECLAFARSVAEALARDSPRSFTADVAKSMRRGRIYLDYLRNLRGATAVAAFSTRARAGAPVSTPLAWDELGPRLRSDHFTVSNLPRRLASMRQDPWKEYATTHQPLPAVSR
jgi:bifunctional non-homologous end joining protein LigD